MMIRIVVLIPMVLTSSVLLIAALCRKRAEIRRRRFVGRLEKALRGSAEIHS